MNFILGFYEVLMFQILIPKIKGKMAEKGYTNSTLAKELGISRNALYVYMREPGRIPYSVMDRMAELLCDSLGEARGIFTASTRENNPSGM